MSPGSTTFVGNGEYNPRGPTVYYPEEVDRDERDRGEGKNRKKPTRVRQTTKPEEKRKGGVRKQKGSRGRTREKKVE